MGFEDELEESRARLGKLKANVHVWAIQMYIDELRKKWRPKIKEIEGPVYHGSKADDIAKHTLYWDVINCKWDSKENAFRSYVIRTLQGVISI